MIRKIFACAALLLAAGCGSTYYRIGAPTTGQVYYTTGYQDLGYGQGIRFNDLKTGAMVTLQSTEIKPIHKEELPPELAGK